MSWFVFNSNSFISVFAWQQRHLLFKFNYLFTYFLIGFNFLGVKAPGSWTTSSACRFDLQTNRLSLPSLIPRSCIRSPRPIPSTLPAATFTTPTTLPLPLSLHWKIPHPVPDRPIRGLLDPSTPTVTVNVCIPFLSFCLSLFIYFPKLKSMFSARCLFIACACCSAD